MVIQSSYSLPQLTLLLRLKFSFSEEHYGQGIFCFKQTSGFFFAFFLKICFLGIFSLDIWVLLPTSKFLEQRILFVQSRYGIEILKDL